MRMKQVFIAAAMLLTPTMALAAPGIVTASVSLRAGPGTGFPMVDRIPGGAHVNIHGCLRGDAWCDVSWSDDRGWVSSQYLEYLYRNRYVYLPDYVDVIDVPIVPFVLSSYWSSYYPGRPFFHRRAYWNGYWQSHARFATRIDRSARSGRTDARTPVVEGRTRTGIAPGVTRQQSIANVRGAQALQGRHAQERFEQGRFKQERAAHVNGENRNFSRMQQPMSRGREAPRFSAAPAARPAMPAHIAQPNVGRPSGPPMNARAQISAPHAAPAMPHAAPAAAPRGPAASGPPGRQRH